MIRRRTTLTCLAVAASAASATAAYALVAGENAASGAKPAFAHLLGASEAPSTGDPDGRGAASVQVVSPTKVCFSLIVNGIATPNAAHIHQSAKGVAGPVVIVLKQPTKGTAGTSAGCVTGAAAVVSQIAKKPAGFYVNVHNGAYPGGAIRGQLSAAR
jgi:hypothetical protein